ncbi:MAG: fumarylacetoacetate hydrolase family protein [Frankiaceae bacterium]|nr:fumarylacetoacetate hydrolase family protein [Frankiaceae bacterium]
MRLVSYGPIGCEQPGALVDDQIVPLEPWLAEFGVSGAGMNAVLGLFSVLRSDLEGYVAGSADQGIAVATTRLGPPVPRPPTLIVIGGNFHSHVQEMAGMNGGKPPIEPIIVPKPTTNLVGPTDDIGKPAVTSELDYEAEMAVVIGRSGRNITREQAMTHVAGYMNIQDMTARDLILPEGEPWMHLQMGRAKGFDGSSPCGPWLLTADEVPNPQDLEICMWVNDELRQKGSTSDMVVDIPGLVESVSAVFRLRPGDILITGTPAGVGAKMTPPRFLQPGDRIRMSITGLGETGNTIVAAS